MLICDADGELDDFVCNSSSENKSSSPRRKRLKTNAPSSSESESYQGDDLNSQEEKQKLITRALPESSDDSLEAIPVKRKRLRKAGTGETPDCIPKIEESDLIDHDDPKPSTRCSLVLEFTDEEEGKVVECRKELRNRVESSDESGQEVKKDSAGSDEHMSGLASTSIRGGIDGGLDHERKSRRNLTKFRTGTNLLQQIMENRGKVLGKLKDNSTTISSTSSSNQRDSSGSEVSIFYSTLRKLWARNVFADVVLFIHNTPHPPAYKQLSLQI